MATELARRIRGTRTRLGSEVRNLFVRSTGRECEPLIVSDLDSGNKFIIFPEPGDNGGHGGLLNGSYLYIKTAKITHPESPPQLDKVL